MNFELKNQKLEIAKKGQATVTAESITLSRCKTATQERNIVFPVSALGAKMYNKEDDN